MRTGTTTCIVLREMGEDELEKLLNEHATQLKGSGDPYANRLAVITLGTLVDLGLLGPCGTEFVDEPDSEWRDYQWVLRVPADSNEVQLIC